MPSKKRTRNASTSSSAASPTAAKTRSSKRTKKGRTSKANQAQPELFPAAEVAQEGHELEEEPSQARTLSRATGKRKQKESIRADNTPTLEAQDNNDIEKAETPTEASSPKHTLDEPPLALQPHSGPGQLLRAAAPSSVGPQAASNKSKGIFSRIGSFLGNNNNNKQKVSKNHDQQEEDTASQPLSKKRKTSHSQPGGGSIRSLVNGGIRSASGNSSFFGLFQSSSGSSSSTRALNREPSDSPLPNQAEPQFASAGHLKEPLGTAPAAPSSAEADSIPRAESAALLALVRNEETPFRRAINAMLPTDPSSILNDLPLVGASAAARLELTKEEGEVETEAQLEVDDAAVAVGTGLLNTPVGEADVDQHSVAPDGQIEEDAFMEGTDEAVPNGKESPAENEGEKSFADQILEAAAVPSTPSSRRGATPHILTSASPKSPSRARSKKILPSDMDEEEEDLDSAQIPARSNLTNRSESIENEGDDGDETRDAEVSMSFDSLSHPASELALGIPTKRLRSGNLALATSTSSHLRYSDPSGGADLASAEASRRRRSRSRSRSVRRSLGAGEGGDEEEEDEDAKSVVSTSTAAALLEERLDEAEEEDEEQPVKEEREEDEGDTSRGAEREPSPPITRAALAMMIAELERTEEGGADVEVRRSARIAGEDSELLISLSDAEEEEKKRAKSEAAETGRVEAAGSQESVVTQSPALVVDATPSREDEQSATQETFSNEEIVVKEETEEQIEPVAPVASPAEEEANDESEEDAAIISPRKAVESPILEETNLNLELSPSPRERTPLLDGEEAAPISSQITAVASQEFIPIVPELASIADVAEPVAVLAGEDPTAELLGAGQIEPGLNHEVEAGESDPTMSQVANHTDVHAAEADSVGTFVIDTEASRPLADYQAPSTADVGEMQEIGRGALTVSGVTEVQSTADTSQALSTRQSPADGVSLSRNFNDQVPAQEVVADGVELVTTTGPPAEDLFLSDGPEPGQEIEGPAAASSPPALESAPLLSQEPDLQSDEPGAESQSTRREADSQPLRPLDNSAALSENWRRSGSPAGVSRATPNFIKIGMGASPASLRATPSDTRGLGFGSSTPQGRADAAANDALFTPLTNVLPGQGLWSQIPGSSKRKSAQFGPSESMRSFDPPPPVLTFDQDFAIISEVRAWKRRAGRNSVGSNASTSVAGGSRIPRKSGAMVGRVSGVGALWPMGHDEHKYKVERARSKQFEMLRANYYEIARREDAKWKRADFYQMVNMGLLRMKADEKRLASRVGGGGIPEKTDETRLEQFMANLRVRAEAARQQVPIPAFKREVYEALKTKHHFRLLNRHGVLGRPPLPSSLTAEQEKIVDQTFRRQGKILEFPGASISDTDIARLRPGVWLNDESINMYGILITMRAQQAELERARLAKEGRTDFKRDAEVRRWNAFWKVHVFNSSFTGKVHREGHKGVARWTSRKKINIFEKDVVLMPINCDNEHWTCGAINFRKKRIEYYDSLRSGTVPDFFQDMRNYLRGEHMAVFKCEMDLGEWEDYQAIGNPQQKNAVDCGMFATQTMEHLSRRHPWIPYPTKRAYPDPTKKKDAPAVVDAGGGTDDQTDRAEDDEEYEKFEFWNFKQENMPYLRRRMVYELAQSKLLD